MKIGSRHAAVAPQNLSRPLQTGQPVTDPGEHIVILQVHHNSLHLLYPGELAVLQLIADAVAQTQHGPTNIVSYALAHPGESMPIQVLRLASPAIGPGVLPLVADRMAEQSKLTMELLEGA